MPLGKDLSILIIKIWARQSFKQLLQQGGWRTEAQQEKDKADTPGGCEQRWSASGPFDAILGEPTEILKDATGE